MKRLIAVLVLTAFAGLAVAQDLATYSQKFKQGLEEISIAHSTKVSELGKGYCDALQKRLDAVRRSGSLEMTSLCSDEIARFESDKTMPAELSSEPEIQKLQAAFTSQSKALDVDKATKVVALAARCDVALESLSKSLVSSGNMSGAETVKAARESLWKSNAVTASKSLLAEVPKPATPVVAVKEEIPDAPAEVVPISGFKSIGPLACGERVWSNKDTTFRCFNCRRSGWSCNNNLGVNPGLSVSKFTVTELRDMIPMVFVEVKKPGWVYFTYVGDPGTLSGGSSSLGNNWENTGTEFYFTGQGNLRMYVFRKKCETGKIILPKMGVGSMLLIP